MSSTPTTIIQQPAIASGLQARLFILGRKRKVVLCLLLVLVTLGFYNSIVQNGFTTLDDEVYILHNPHVRAGLTWNTFTYAFTTFDTANWHPLTWLSHALDCQLFNLNPAGHHYVNLLLHALNAILLFLLLEAATGLTWPSLMVAALFALHPVNVESVAWAAERKNVLSMTFFLLAMHAYGWYVRRVSVKRYAALAALFALGLMAKPEIITLPCVLLLWDYWPLQRMNGQRHPEHSTGEQSPRSFSFLVLEKLPLLLIALGSAVVTIAAERSSDTVRSGFTVARIGNALVAYVRYLGKAFWPTQLAVMYPYHGHSIPAWAILSSAAGLLFVTAVVLHFRRHRYLVVGWFWFLGTLVPVIGIIEVGMQAMADRYAYLPFIGLFIAVVWGVAETARRREIPAAWLAVPSVLILAILGMLTRHQVPYWYDGETMWRHTISVTGRNTMAHDGLGYTLAEQGRVEEAIAEYNTVEAMHGYGAPAIIQVGVFEQNHGRLQEALGQYKQSLDVSADADERSEAYARMGAAFVQMGDMPNAKIGYGYALQQNPKNTFALIGSGLLAEREGDFTVALGQIARALKVQPTDVGYLLLAQALRRAGRMPEADQAEQYAQQISSDLNQARQSAAQELASAGLKPE
ncbi:MAG: tetratricopeptide repeat protein [Candidatus Sulfotelmatobacter sp.]